MVNTFGTGPDALEEAVTVTSGKDGVFEDQRRHAARRKEQSGGEKARATIGMAGICAVPPSSGFFDC